MKTVIPASEIVIKLLGKAESADSYRLLTYVISKKVEEGILLFNNLTRELLLLSKEEYDRLYDLPELYEKWFIVPKDTDDIKLVDQIRFVLRTTQSKTNEITNYTILTTTDCNARCFYCYEKDARHYPMNDETALQVVNFIEKHHGNERICLHWFGGEPLYNMRAIDIITDGLKKKNTHFFSTMVSNGYLIDDEMIQKAKDLWKLTRVQITLDGTKQIYNKTKNYIYDEGDPFEIVIKNIERCILNKIHVTVRMNVTKTNVDDLIDLVKFLHNHFKKSKYLSIYSHLLFQIQNNTDGKSILVNQKKLILDEAIYKCTFQTGFGLSRQLKINSCEADNDHAIIILPDGKLGACEHYIDSDFIGSIWSDTIDEQARIPFKEHVSRIPECNSCSLYPDCLFLKKCTPHFICNKEYREANLIRQKHEIASCFAYLQRKYNNKNNDKGNLKVNNNE